MTIENNLIYYIFSANSLKKKRSSKFCLAGKHKNILNDIKLFINNFQLKSYIFINIDDVFSFTWGLETS